MKCRDALDADGHRWRTIDRDWTTRMHQTTQAMERLIDPVVLDGLLASMLIEAVFNHLDLTTPSQA